MRRCAVCKTEFHKGTGTLFFAPKNQETRRNWSEICGVKLSEFSKVCSNHFLPSSIVRVGERPSLLTNAEPFMKETQKISDESLKQQPDNIMDDNFENFYFPFIPSVASPDNVVWPESE